MNEIKFIHLIDEKVTIAFKYATDDSVVMFSVAHCNPKDQYSRKIGRYITTNRLLAMEDSIDPWINHWGVIDTPRRLTYREVKEYIMQDIGIPYKH